MRDPDSRQSSPPLPEASQRRTRWPGWVWLIPLVALGFAGWLVVEQWVVGPKPLTVHFTSVEGIKPGAPVILVGRQVGNVTGTGLEVAPDGSGRITPVTIMIDARQMAMDNLAELDSREALRKDLDAIIRRLVRAGMRAHIKEGGVVFGARSIELVIEHDRPPGEFRSGVQVPVIPAAGGGAPARASGNAGEGSGQIVAPGSASDQEGKASAPGAGSGQQDRAEQPSESADEAPGVP